MTEFKKLAPEALILQQISDLPLFFAVLARATVFISGDTGPLHFAAGLGVPTISLFGPTPPSRWAPIGEKHLALTGGNCGCDGHLFACASQKHCLAQISPEAVLAALQNKFSAR
jgi:ADP-heptose:LPS heptosyltransferase